MTPADIETLEARRNTAMLESDVDALDALLDDTLIWNHASSKVEGKAALLQDFVNGARECFAFTPRDMEYRVYGTTGVATGILAMDVAMNGNRIQAENRFTTIWALRDGAMRMVLWHSTRTA